MITSLPVWWRHFLRDLGSLCAFITTRPYIFAVSRWCSERAAAIWGSMRPYSTASFVAAYQQQPHLFNSDLEGEASVWAGVLMIQSPSRQAPQYKVDCGDHLSSKRRMNHLWQDSCLFDVPARNYLPQQRPLSISQSLNCGPQLTRWFPMPDPNMTCITWRPQLRQRSATALRAHSSQRFIYNHSAPLMLKMRE